MAKPEFPSGEHDPLAIFRNAFGEPIPQYTEQEITRLHHAAMFAVVSLAPFVGSEFSGVLDKVGVSFTQEQREEARRLAEINREEIEQLSETTKIPHFDPAEIKYEDIRMIICEDIPFLLSGETILPDSNEIHPHLLDIQRDPSGISLVQKLVNHVSDQAAQKALTTEEDQVQAEAELALEEGSTEKPLLGIEEIEGEIFNAEAFEQTRKKLTEDRIRFEHGFLYNDGDLVSVGHVHVAAAGLILNQYTRAVDIYLGRWVK